MKPENFLPWSLFLIVVAAVLVFGSAAERRVGRRERSSLKSSTQYASLTVTIPAVQWKETNVLEVIPNHEHADPLCTLIRYLDADGRTNTFHAWAVEVLVSTNRKHYK